MYNGVRGGLLVFIVVSKLDHQKDTRLALYFSYCRIFYEQTLQLIQSAQPQLPVHIIP